MSRSLRPYRRIRAGLACTLGVALLTALCAATPAAAQGAGTDLASLTLDAKAVTNVASAPSERPSTKGRTDASGPQAPTFFKIRVDDPGRAAGGDGLGSASVELDLDGHRGALTLGAVDFAALAPISGADANAEPGLLFSGSLAGGMADFSVGQSFASDIVEGIEGGDARRGAYRVSLSPVRTASLRLGLHGGLYELERPRTANMAGETNEIWSVGGTVGLWNDRVQVQADGLRSTYSGALAADGPVSGNSLSVRTSVQAVSLSYAALEPYVAYRHTGDGFVTAEDGARPDRDTLAAGLEARYRGSSLRYEWAESRTDVQGNAALPTTRETTHRANAALGLDALRRELGLSGRPQPLLPRKLTLGYGWTGVRNVDAANIAGGSADLEAGMIPDNRRERVALGLDWRWAGTPVPTTSLSLSRETFDNTAFGRETADTVANSVRLNHAWGGPDWTISTSLAHSYFANADRAARRRARSWELCIKAGWQPENWPDLSASFGHHRRTVRLDTQGRSEGEAHNRLELSADFGDLVPAFGWAGNDDDDYLRARYVRDRAQDPAPGGVFGVDQRFMVEYGIRY